MPSNQSYRSINCTEQYPNPYSYVQFDSHKVSSCYAGCITKFCLYLTRLLCCPCRLSKMAAWWLRCHSVSFSQWTWLQTSTHLENFLISTSMKNGANEPTGADLERFSYMMEKEEEKMNAENDTGIRLLLINLLLLNQPKHSVTALAFQT